MNEVESFLLKIQYLHTEWQRIPRSRTRKFRRLTLTKSFPLEYTATVYEMTISADLGDEKQGILSFFQTNTQDQRTPKEESYVSRKESGIILETNDVSASVEEEIEIIDEDDDPNNNENGDGSVTPANTDRDEPYVAKDQSEKSIRRPEKSGSFVEALTGSEAATNQEASAPNKKEELRKLREMKRRQKEEEKRQREEQRQEEKRKREQQREEEKRKREDRKKRKEFERLEAKRQKELEKLQKEQERREKEQERRQKEEEKLKKDEERKIREETKQRSQSRIGNFFKKVSDATKQLNVKSDYEKYFLPFYAKDGTILPKSWPASIIDLEESKSSLDKILSGQEHKSDENDALTWLNSKRTNRGYKIKFTATALLQQMTAKEKEDSQLMNLLLLIPQKYIKFYENVRPPYIGTYSKDAILPTDDPFSTEGTGFNYEYDSDLEWVNEEEEEGEEGGVDNLESGEEDEDEDEDEASEGEFDGFLEAEEKSADGIQGKKRKFLGPLIPTVCLRSNINDMDASDRRYFGEISVTYTSEQYPFPIDPNVLTSKQQSSNGTKRALIEDQADAKSTSTSPSVSPEKKRAKSLITDKDSLLKLFEEVDGSTFSLGTVTEIAQKNLPQYSKQAIKNTVKEYAIRGTGPTRKWQIKDQKHWEILRSSVN